MKQTFPLILLLALLAGGHLYAQTPTTGLYVDSGGLLLMNHDDVTPLSGGVGTVVGDGDVVQFGYYTDATSSNLFAGTWVPLTGNGGANSAFNTTSIGDNPDGLGAGNTDGQFAFTATGSIPGDTYINFTLGSATSGVSLPSSGQIMALRFYNGTSVANSTYYGAASDASWDWIAPAYPPPLPMEFTMGDPVSWLDNDVGFTGTSLSPDLVVPEPSEMSLGGLGGLGVLAFAYWRRRRFGH